MFVFNHINNKIDFIYIGFGIRTWLPWFYFWMKFILFMCSWMYFIVAKRRITVKLKRSFIWKFRWRLYGRRESTGLIPCRWLTLFPFPSVTSRFGPESLLPIPKYIFWKIWKHILAKSLLVFARAWRRLRLCPCCDFFPLWFSSEVYFSTSKSLHLIWYRT